MSIHGGFSIVLCTTGASIGPDPGLVIALHAGGASPSHRTCKIEELTPKAFLVRDVLVCFCERHV